MWSRAAALESDLGLSVAIVEPALHADANKKAISEWIVDHLHKRVYISL
jgi:hypothetical protein